MSNIDDIFKKGLDGKGMEYSDASWADMEGMLGGKKVGFIEKQSKHLPDISSTNTAMVLNINEL